MSNLIPFNAWSKERILAGKKHCTSRHKMYKDDIAVNWISPMLPWWFIKKYLWQAEGANSPEELQEVINSIYKRVVPEGELFYVHFGNFMILAKERGIVLKGE